MIYNLIIKLINFDFCIRIDSHLSEQDEKWIGEEQKSKNVKNVHYKSFN